MKADGKMKLAIKYKNYSVTTHKIGPIKLR